METRTNDATRRVSRFIISRRSERVFYDVTPLSGGPAANQIAINKLTATRIRGVGIRELTSNLEGTGFWMAARALVSDYRLTSHR